MCRVPLWECLIVDLPSCNLLTKINLMEVSTQFDCQQIWSYLNMAVVLFSNSSQVILAKARFFKFQKLVRILYTVECRNPNQFEFQTVRQQNRSVLENVRNRNEIVQISDVGTIDKTSLDFGRFGQSRPFYIKNLNIKWFSLALKNLPPVPRFLYLRDIIDECSQSQKLAFDILLLPFFSYPIL